MQEWAEVVQRLHSQEQHIWSLISTLQTMSGWKHPIFLNLHLIPCVSNSFLLA